MWSEEKLLEYSEDYFVQSSNPDRKIFITKGDNNARCDQCYGIPPVPESNVYGKAVIVIPYLGWVKILFVKFFIESPIYGIMFILISTVVYSIYKR